MSVYNPAHDAVRDARCSGTAAKLVQLAALRGVAATIVWDGSIEPNVPGGTRGAYVANGVNCGPSTHGVLEWLDKQLGVKP